MTISIENAETGMELRDLLLDADFPRRGKSEREHISEGDALRRLAGVFAETPELMLQELVELAVEACGADSAGISLEEKSDTGEPRFRWIAVAGSFAQYVEGTTPRFFSPCGTCLDKGRAQLYRVTEPYYDYLGIKARPITDGMLIPWVNAEMRGTLWAVSHESEEAFDLEDYKLLKSLADFTSVAVWHGSQEKLARQRGNDAASAARANELAHQINNPLQSLTNTIYLAAQDGEETQVYLRKAIVELRMLSDLVKKLLVA